VRRGGEDSEGIEKEKKSKEGKVFSKKGESGKRGKEGVSLGACNPMKQLCLKLQVKPTALAFTLGLVCCFCAGTRSSVPAILLVYPLWYRLCVHPLPDDAPSEVLPPHPRGPACQLRPLPVPNPWVCRGEGEWVLISFPDEWTRN